MTFFSSFQSLFSLFCFSLIFAKYCISYPNSLSSCSAELQWHSVQPDAASAKTSDKASTAANIWLITALL